MVEEREKRASNNIVDTGTLPQSDGGADEGEGVPPSKGMEVTEVKKGREEQDVGGSGGDLEHHTADEEGNNDEHGDGVEGAMEDDDDTRGKPSLLQTLYRGFAFCYVT